MSEEQAGFRKNYSTMEYVKTLGNIIEKVLEIYHGIILIICQLEQGVRTTRNQGNI